MAEEKNFVVKTYRLGVGDLAHRIVHKALGTFLSSQTDNYQVQTAKQLSAQHLHDIGT